MRTFTPKPGSQKDNWYIVDATKKKLGRLATSLAFRLQGKHLEEYTPNFDIGDYIIVINADKICVTGNKYHNKIYYHHTGYIGNLKKIAFKEMIRRHPKRVIEIAVQGMLPKGSLGRFMLRKLKVYSGNNHYHYAQNPKNLDI
ncbi:MAG: 50S ribosomal protein L13 [Candidatus Dasytiphilus stammeri]